MGKLGNQVGDSTAKMLAVVEVAFLVEDVVVVAADTNVPVARSNAPNPVMYMMMAKKTKGRDTTAIRDEMKASLYTKLIQDRESRTLKTKCLF